SAARTRAWGRMRNASEGRSKAYLSKVTTSSTLSRPRRTGAVPGVVSTPICAAEKVERNARKAGVTVSKSPRLARLTTRMRRGRSIGRILAVCQLVLDGFHHVVDAQRQQARW